MYSSLIGARTKRWTVLVARVREKKNPHLIWWENLMDRDRRVENFRVGAMKMLNLYL